MKWKCDIQPALYRALTIGVLSRMNNGVCVHVGLQVWQNTFCEKGDTTE